ncbi:MAG: ABC transporter ATP-binding protein [Fretibacterium sp.]|nr:ABC transporter ATP-binding protein [Fretibacterium sp.]
MNGHEGAEWAFRLRALTSGYGDRTILRGIDADIPAGCLTSLIGPNGSGKSTLLRALAGLQPYGGMLKLAGPGGEREVCGISRREFALLAGVVPQGFHPSYPFSVWEVIGMGRLPCRGLLGGQFTREDDERIVAAARRVGVEELLSRPITALSGGEAQRVLIACVLAQDPPIFLLDEPTSALDPNQAARVFGLLRELAEEGRTVVAVVHDINASLAFSGHYLALREGRLIARGPMRELNGNVLQSLYGTPFLPYRSERGDVMWRALAE